MNKREFLRATGAAAVTAVLPYPGHAAPARGAGDYRNLLILVELRGGNDALNTVVPYAAPEYAALRPRLAVSRDDVLQLDARTGLHPSLAPLLPAWEARELAIVQGLGYAQPNLSHFRSIEIWDTASQSAEYLTDGWLARLFAAAPPPRGFAADAVVVGKGGLGPLAGSGARAITLDSTERFARDASLAGTGAAPRTGALGHLLKVEGDIVQAARGLVEGPAVDGAFPSGAFGNAVHNAARIAANDAGVAVIKLALNGFDTHSGQAATHARLLRELAEGLSALRTSLVQSGRWRSTLIATYAEFGRRARENQSGGTDHGTAAAHFLLGGRVVGGLFGEAPQLARLDGNGNLAHAVDFRQLYATIVEGWWGLDAHAALRGRFAQLPLIRA